MGGGARFNRLKPANNEEAHRHLGRAQCRSNRSPVGVSGKREYFNEWPETFGCSRPKLMKLGVWRLATEFRKPAISGLFCD
ncbi:MAG: hypothetical protein QOJ84_1581 [Bradyrhizobium sp.]|nr:hypothetical protein [Bradyrhizobium sp.]